MPAHASTKIDSPRSPKKTLVHGKGHQPSPNNKTVIRDFHKCQDATRVEHKSGPKGSKTASARHLNKQN